jgi:chromosome condensin MukBEF ATPase and DNA-binding subunit MukB
MAKSIVASRLLSSEVNVRKAREAVTKRIKHLVEEVDMALYDRSSGIGFVYTNLGDLLRRVQSVGARGKPNLTHRAMVSKDEVLRKDSLAQLKDNVERLNEMHARLQFMLSELEGLVKKS